MVQSDLELMVEYDMYQEGYDPSCQEDIENYWKERLDED